MKLSKKVRKDFINSVVSQVNPHAKTGHTITMMHYSTEMVEGKEFCMPNNLPTPQYINHKRRVKTLIRSCSNDAQLLHEAGKYIDKYPKKAA